MRMRLQHQPLDFRGGTDLISIAAWTPMAGPRPLLTRKVRDHTAHLTKIARTDLHPRGAVTVVSMDDVADHPVHDESE